MHGLERYRVFIRYCVFSKSLKYILDSGLSRFPLGFSLCTQWQVKLQRLQQNLHSSEKSQNFKEKDFYVLLQRHVGERGIDRSGLGKLHFSSSTLI